jgi:hypothetical protein
MHSWMGELVSSDIPSSNFNLRLLFQIVSRSTHLYLGSLRIRRIDPPPPNRSTDRGSSRTGCIDVYVALAIFLFDLASLRAVTSLS